MPVDDLNASDRSSFNSSINSSINSSFKSNSSIFKEKLKKTSLKLKIPEPKLEYYINSHTVCSNYAIIC